MKDLDFDELDRAVNSLIGGSSSTPATPPTTNPTPVVPETPTVAPVITQPVATTVSPQPLAARRSSGRFMDVVHPSSDMRTTLSAPRPTISREAAPVVPTIDTATDVTLQTDTIQDAPVVTESSSESEWPDPLDFNAYKPEQYNETPAVEAVVVDDNDSDQDIDNIADAINQSLGQDNVQEPQESPFLSDAKVEKRPLGAFSVEPVAEVAPIEAPVQVDFTAELQAEPESSEPAEDAQSTELSAPLPAELQSDLLSIESDQDTTGQAVDAAPAVLVAISPAQPMETISIPQQYTEKSSTGDQPVGAIFDTEAYRKPLTHPSHNKSGWLMVLWILLLLIVGAGAGAVVYFYVLPML